MVFNVVRPATPPLSLASRQSYASEDVLIMLKDIFFNKCYLCECKEPHDINIEHFRPHKNNEDLKFDWKNLFYVCSRCNNIKLDSFDNILDCTDQDIDVFERIKLLPPRTPNAELVLVEAICTDERTKQTVELLNKIYNEPTTVNKAITAAHLRKKVFKAYNRLLELMNIYFSDEESPERKSDALSRMRELMKRHQEFSAFLRWLILEDKVLSTLLRPEID